ncbi:MAG: hypothetical protein GY820_03520 [Gammaproteobacteria bacterium]|nr:hypothetical protein [Gammaproteobacteria bacterium]
MKKYKGRHLGVKKGRILSQVKEELFELNSCSDILVADGESEIWKIFNSYLMVPEFSSSTMLKATR